MQEIYQSSYACLDNEAIRLEKIDSDNRSPFFRDVDKIVFSLPYSRYIDKTQVFSIIKNDHVTKRIHHVQMVSRVARYIGRRLGLNEDLIEAASLGHDLGHVPFGHEGERIVNEISLKYLNRYFNHNVHSVRTVMNVANYGYGLNVTVQVLDAILCHNGELECKEYAPQKKSINDFLHEYEETYVVKDKNKELVPMTLEGCVVRVSDIIAYLGRDIEDAIRLGVITYSDLPENIREFIGTSNANIIDYLVNDLISNSLNHNYLEFSEEAFSILQELKKYNYEHIYHAIHTKEELDYFRKVLWTVYEASLDDLKNNRGRIWNKYLTNFSLNYKKNNSYEQIALDYVAGMTDDFLISQYESIVKK